MPPDFDLAIIGSGFGGSLLAMIARRLGQRVALLERGRHPRFAIGESASPLAGVLIEQLADRYDLPRVRPLASHGEWQRRYPEIACGLKRGFTYFKHEEGVPYVPAPDRSNQLLVAASPSDELSDTHWLRADVDCFLVHEACALGVEYVDECALDSLAWRADGTAALTGMRRTHPVRLTARGVVDASGPRGFLTRTLGLPSAAFDGYPDTQALYSHFTGVRSCEGVMVPRGGGPPPFPADDAALHHVFDGGWMWVLRFANGVTSAGVAVSDALAADLRLADGAPAWHRLLARYPSIAEQFAGAQPIREFTWIPRVAWRSSRAADACWAMLPSAAAFVDPLFSSGIPMTLLGIERIARAIEQGNFARGADHSGSPRANDGFAARSPAWHQEYERVTLREADHTARFIAGCYAAFPRFDSFVAFSMFYFVAASFTEMARRLGQPSRGFLCADDEAFAASLRECAAAVRDARLTPAQVARATERLNVAGLCDASKRNWYGVDFEDLVRGAEKLGVAAVDIARVVADSTERPCIGPTPGSTRNRTRRSHTDR